MKLSVLQDKNIVILYFGNTEVARLGTKKGQRIASCITAGFRYEGTVREKNGTKYAEVIRTN